MKIRIVKAESSSYWYADKIGEVFEVTEDGFDGGYFVRYNGEDDSYHVSTGKFEIVDKNETEAIGVANVNFDGMNYGEIETFAIKAIEALRLSAYREGYKQGRFDQYVEGSQRFEVHGKLAVRTPQEIRDDIVAQAKRDVEDLKNAYGEYEVNVKGSVGRPCCYAEFIVNTEKRTVVVILRGGVTRQIYAKGIAKADPSDCFNASLGRAISLHRALGLEVPAEYFQAPQPTEVRVGDVILRKGYSEECHGLRTVTEERKNDDGSKSYITKEGNGTTAEKNIVKIIDDSRDTCPQ